MKAKSIKGKSTEEIQSVLQQSIAGGFKPTLAFVFITNIENADALRSILDKEGIAIFGASTSQKFTEHGIESDDIVALLLDINPAHFKVVLKDYDEAHAYESARQVGEIGKNIFQNPAFIISAINFKIPGEYVIKGLMDAVSKDVTIIGGMAGEMVNFTGIVFTND